MQNPILLVLHARYTLSFHLYLLAISELAALAQLFHVDFNAFFRRISLKSPK